MKKLFSFVLMIGLFLLMGCPAPTVNSTASGSISGGIQIPDSFLDIRLSSWQGYDENYQYYINVHPQGKKIVGNMGINNGDYTAPDYISISTTSNNPVTVNGRLSLEFSCEGTQYLPGSGTKIYHIKAKLVSDPNRLLATLYLEISPDLNPNISKTIRMRRVI